MANSTTVKATVYSNVVLFILLGLSISILTDNYTALLIGVIGAGILLSIYRILVWQFIVEEKENEEVEKVDGVYKKFNPAWVHINIRSKLEKQESFVKNTGHNSVTLYCDNCGLFMNTHMEASMPPEWLPPKEKEYIETPGLLVCRCTNCSETRRLVS